MQMGRSWCQFMDGRWKKGLSNEVQERIEEIGEALQQGDVKRIASKWTTSISWAD